MKVENIVFARTANIAEIGTLKERVKANGTIRRVYIRFYSGQELDLRIRPYVLHKNNRAEDFFTYPEGTKTYISGDADVFEYSISLDIEYDDEICIDYENTNLSYLYDFVVVVEVAYNFNEEEVR